MRTRGWGRGRENRRDAGPDGVVVVGGMAGRGMRGGVVVRGRGGGGGGSGAGRVRGLEGWSRSRGSPG